MWSPSRLDPAPCPPRGPAPSPVAGPPPAGPGPPLGTPHYVSADSAPAGYAVRRSVWVAPAFLAVLAGSCAAVTPSLPSLTSWYAGVLGALGGMERTEVLGPSPSPSFRPFLLLLIVCLGLFAVGSVGQRLRLVASASLLFAGMTVALDFVLLAGSPPLPGPLSEMGGLPSGFGGLFVIVYTVFTRYRLPDGVRVRTRVRTSRTRRRIVSACAVAAVGLVAALSWVRDTYFDGLHVRFIGGMDSEVVLFLLAMTFLLRLVSGLERWRRPQGAPDISIAFLIPAYNEAAGIAACIEALDNAAARHAGPSHLYVVDNGSVDGTREVAAEAIARCRHLRGDVLVCPTPGKSHALNFGLAHITEDVILRIDADTLVKPSILRVMLPWFRIPSVGGVGGLPLPKEGTPRWLHPLRIIEVLYGVALLRVAQGAADGIMVIPGLVACYRREVVEDLGGFGEGFNGEDADITMRIGRLGYRVVTDPEATVYTEVPASLAHLREQRQRWARGLFHMAARNMSCIRMRQGLRGLLILPWSIFNAARRSMMVPVLVAVVTVELLDPSVFSLREVSVLAGFIVGLQAIVICVVLLAHRRFRELPFVPLYLLFRLFRAYVAFETVLTLRLAPGRRRGGRTPDEGGRGGASRPAGAAARSSTWGRPAGAVRTTTT